MQTQDTQVFTHTEGTISLARVGEAEGITLFRDLASKLHFACGGSELLHHPDDLGSGYVSITACPSIVVCMKNSEHRVLRAYLRNAKKWIDWSGQALYFVCDRYCVLRNSEAAQEFTVFMIETEEYFSFHTLMTVGATIRRMLCLQKSFAFAYSVAADEPLMWRIIDATTWKEVRMCRHEGNVVSYFDQVYINGKNFCVFSNGRECTF